MEANPYNPLPRAPYGDPEKEARRLGIIDNHTGPKIDKESRLCALCECEVPDGVSHLWRCCAKNLSRQLSTLKAVCAKDPGASDKLEHFLEENAELRRQIANLESRIEYLEGWREGAIEMAEAWRGGGER